MMKPVVAAVGAALISGVTMFTLGAKTTQLDAFATPEFVRTVDGGFVPASQVTYPGANRFTSTAPVSAPRPVATRTVYRTAAPAQVQERVVTQETVTEPNHRSWQKTAMVIGGSAATGAGIGGITSGKKGALIGAAIGGGAASIYEATRRH